MDATLVPLSFPLSSPPQAKAIGKLLDPGFDLTLRPMRYPQFFAMYRDAIRNTWTVEEVDFAPDVQDLALKLGPAERHLVQRLVAFFATGDSIVANNLVLNLYRHINAPEARMYLSRQLYEEALHVQFYLTLLDAYLPDPAERAKAFAAVENIPSIRAKAAFCFRWIDSIQSLERLDTPADRRRFLLNLACFATCIEGLFFFAAFAYVYYLRIAGGKEPLDASAVHPEAYPVVEKIVKACGRPIGQLIGDAATLRGLKLEAFTDERFGLPTVRDIVRELEKPGRDPRPEFKAARFADGIEDLKDLRPGMVLEGVVTNVAAFGAFVDIGVHQDGLVHISALSDKFVKDPREVVKVGDVVKVKVLEVDVARKRIALTRRLEDVPGEARGKREERPLSKERGGRDAPKPRDARGGRDSASGAGNGPAPANTAMADALKALKR